MKNRKKTKQTINVFVGPFKRDWEECIVNQVTKRRIVKVTRDTQLDIKPKQFYKNKRKFY